MQLLPNDKDLGWTPFAWLIYLSFFLIGPLADPHPTVGKWAITLAGIVVFLALYFRGYWARGTELVLIIAAITLLGAIYFPFNPGAGCFFIYACAFAGRLKTVRAAIEAIVIIELLTIIEVLVFHISPFNAVWPLVFNVIVGGVDIHFAERKRANKKLSLAQEEVEHLAKLAERERIARDLHDLLGHTLSLIILKSELASKLAERDALRARDEIRDVERISRDALAQVRAAVLGYRSGGLQAELAEARKALATASVELESEIAKLSLPAGYEAVLALALREAVTNVIRHADALRCTIRFSEPCTLTIEDDGRGGNAPFGNGLTGMRERVEVLGGSFSRQGGRGTKLTITLPMHADSAVAERSA
jgi:two-component system sensor histidine kinase DesK